MKYLDLYKILLSKEVFRVNEVYKYVKNKQVASNLIQFLLKKKLIRQIKHGFYYAVPLELISKNFTPNSFLVASKLTKKYFLSHYTALELHGLAQTSIDITFVSVSFDRKKFVFNKQEFVFVKNASSFGITKKKINDSLVYYSDLERTFLDCLKNLKYSVSLEVFLKSFENVKLDFKKIEKYLKIFNNNALYQKTGFVLSLMKKDLDVPEELLKKLKKKVSKKTYYLESTAKGLSKKNREWKLMVPKNIEELMQVA